MRVVRFSARFIIACEDSAESLAMSKAVQFSRVDTPVPAFKEQLLALIDSGVKKYFSRENRPKVNVTSELLRIGPSQSGVSYPKYYTWVHVYESNSMTYDGTVRVEVIEQQKSPVTHNCHSNGDSTTPRSAGEHNFKGPYERDLCSSLGIGQR